MLCLRCNKNTHNFPKPSNRRVCGPCLAELHAAHKAAEDPKTGKYIEGNQDVT